MKISGIRRNAMFFRTTKKKQALAVSVIVAFVQQWHTLSIFYKKCLPCRASATSILPAQLFFQPNLYGSSQ
jgi:hypothetical protein